MSEYIKKIIKQYGNTLVITFNREEQKIFKICSGDTLIFSIDKVLKKEEIK